VSEVEPVRLITRVFNDLTNKKLRGARNFHLWDLWPRRPGDGSTQWGPGAKPGGRSGAEKLKQFADIVHRF